MKGTIRAFECLTRDALSAADWAVEWRSEVIGSDCAPRTIIPPRVISPIPALPVRDERIVFRVKAVESPGKRDDAGARDLRDDTAPPRPTLMSRAAPERRAL